MTLSSGRGGNSPGHAPSGWSSHDQNCCGVFDRDGCLQVPLADTRMFGLFVCLFVCFLMRVSSVNTQQSSAEDLHGDIPSAAPTYGCLGLRSPRKQQEYRIWRPNPMKRLLVIEEGRRGAAALISLVLDVLLLLSCNCNQSDSLILLKCRLWRADAGTPDWLCALIKQLFPLPSVSPPHASLRPNLLCAKII